MDKPLPKLQTLTYAEALFEALMHRFYEDPTLIGYGEENRDWGGAFSVYRGLTECLPYHRLFNSPISEAAIVGTAVGYALSGGRVVAELMYCDFMGQSGRRDFQPNGKMAIHVRKCPADADGTACIRRIEVRSAAFARLDLHRGTYSGLESDVPCNRLRRERDVEPGTARNGPGRLL